MDKLKKFIEDNREAFDTEEMLPAGHQKRFEQKLPVSKGKKLFWLTVSGLTIAATVALWIIAQLPTAVSPAPPQQEIVVENCKIKVEIEELRFYYTMKINDITEKMKQLYETNSNEGVAGLWHASQQILADNSCFETEILPTLPCSDDALFAMTQHYQNSLGGLDIMFTQMKELSNQQNSNN